MIEISKEGDLCLCPQTVSLKLEAPCKIVMSSAN